MDQQPKALDQSTKVTSTRGITMWALLFFLIGSGAATYLHWPALTDPLVYKSDVRQSPHWSAYHTDTFKDDDLLLTLAAHNESPLQNLIYFVGTFAVDMVLLGKLLAVLSYGLTAALFFWLLNDLDGWSSGALTALCFTFCPDQFEYSAGGFSKAWMIPIILCCIHLLEKEQWRRLLLLMPFGALAYPVSTVLIGAVVLTYIILEAPTRRRHIVPLFWTLCAASTLALLVLLPKYLFPPAGIGSLTPGHILREMPEMYAGGMWPYLPLPTLLEELTKHLMHPFIILSACVFLACLSLRRLTWSRPMTALLLASLAFYLLATQLYMNLYQPNRYTRYSIAVLLALWHGRNWPQVIAIVPWRTARAMLLIALLGLGWSMHRDTFRIGKDTSPRKEWEPLNQFISTLPAKVLIAGPPKYMDDIPILARRSVLCNYKLAHPWYSDYYPEIRRRTEATFDVLYAADVGPINRLHNEWGVTHLVVVKRHLTRTRIDRRDLYVEPYNSYIKKTTHGIHEFLLTKPPASAIVYENDELYVLALPMAEHAAGS